MLLCRTTSNHFYLSCSSHLLPRHSLINISVRCYHGIASSVYLTMSSNFPPVPSNSALRTLRRVAFASSVGVAAGAVGVLTEDRRRRICWAKKVARNKETLKNCRYYHGASSQAIARE